MFHYRTKGTCSRQIDLEITDGVITACRIVGGCAGNSQGLCRLVIGKRADEVHDTLRGVICRNGTSCPDQLSKAIEQYTDAEAESASRHSIDPIQGKSGE